MGFWLFEFFVMEEFELLLEELIELLEDFFMVLFVVLESFFLVERVVYLFYEVFDYLYIEVGVIFDKLEFVCW